MEDWEDEPVTQLLKKEHPRSNWDDEDVDDDDVKESWEDEDEPAPPPSPVKTAEKPAKKAATKETEKKGKNVEVAKETPLDPVAEKLRQQRTFTAAIRLANEATGPFAHGVAECCSPAVNYVAQS